MNAAVSIENYIPVQHVELIGNMLTAYPNLPVSRYRSMLSTRIKNITANHFLVLGYLIGVLASTDTNDVSNLTKQITWERQN